MVNSWIEKKWINIISGSLSRFKWTGADTANFRCPYCGDSDKNSFKARGYLYQKKGSFWYSCKNCSIGKNFNNFLRDNFSALYTEYKLEKIKEFGSGHNSVSINNSTSTSNGGSHLSLFDEEIEEEEVQYDITVASLPDTHPAKIYCLRRAIPTIALQRILYTDNFKDWVINVLKAEKYKKRNLPKDARILLPLRRTNGNIIGVQGRTIAANSNTIRYITIKKNDLDQKIYGLEFIDDTKPIFGVEGPIDSLFLPNCIGFCGGDVKVPLDVDPANVYAVLDNEPRSKDTVARMRSAIEKGFNVMFWDVNTEYKDINDMIQKGGYSVKEILSMIKRDSRRGMSAYAELVRWKKTKEIKNAR
jgi:hypothetical protein